MNSTRVRKPEGRQCERYPTRRCSQCGRAHGLMEMGRGRACPLSEKRDPRVRAGLGSTDAESRAREQSGPDRTCSRPGASATGGRSSVESIE